MAIQNVSGKRYDQVASAQEHVTKNQLSKNSQVQSSQKMYQDVHIKNGSTLCCLGATKDARTTWFWESYPF